MQEEDLQLIERYLENSLNDKELSDFRQRLETDTVFAEMVQVEKDLHEGIEAMGVDNLRADLDKIYEEEILQNDEIETPAIKPVNRTRWIAIAAAVALLLFAGLWWMNRPTPQKLYAEYFQPTFSFVEKGQTDKNKTQAQQLLNDKQFQEALPILNSLLNTQPNNPDFKLAKAIALIETNDPQNARPLLRELIQSPLYRTEAIWYNALSYLKAGDIGAALDQLKSISEDKRAQGLIEDLEKLQR